MDGAEIEGGGGGGGGERAAANRIWYVFSGFAISFWTRVFVGCEYREYLIRLVYFSRVFASANVDAGANPRIMRGNWRGGNYSWRCHDCTIEEKGPDSGSDSSSYISQVTQGS